MLLNLRIAVSVLRRKDSPGTAAPENKSPNSLSFGRCTSNLSAMSGILQNLYKLQTLDMAGRNTSSPQAAGLRAGIPEGMLANYDRARARGKKAIALVRNHVCTNCRIQVPVAVTASLAAGTIQLCGNCGLYLCLPEQGEQPLTPPPETSAQPRGHKRKRSVAKSGASLSH
jgi:hypothetical protein